MKTSITSLFVFLILSFGIHAAEHPYNGAWYFIKGEYIKPDGQVINATNDGFVAIKTIADNKWALINMGMGNYHGHLAGDFKVEGDSYIEDVKEGSKEHVGNQYKFRGWIETKLENGVKVEYWWHEGMVNGTKEKEVWRRMQ